MSLKSVYKIICYGKEIARKARRLGWLPGARYTNLRDLRGVESVGMIDVDWENYDFDRHLRAVKLHCPLFTVARDLDDVRRLSELKEQAQKLREYASWVIVVPKIRQFNVIRPSISHRRHVLGFSMPSGYGKTLTPTDQFLSAPVHLLGGRPLAQRQMAQSMDVVSFDCNSITIDAAFGKYFDGRGFQRHPRGGYVRCILESMRSINELWDDYRVS